MFGNNYFPDDDGYGMRAQPTRRNRRFDEYYRVYPIAMLAGPERKELNYGGKIMLPPSALEKLTRLHIAYPMLFELNNGAKSTSTHAGVLEFIAEEGRAYLPYWMMQTLLLEPGDLLQLKSTDLPSGTFVKFQPQSTSFINAITDPKAVLENVLRNFSSLTKGDVFQFLYNDEVFEMGVVEVKPTDAVSCVEVDLNVDFAPPLDYVEPTPTLAPGSAGSSRPGSVVGGGRVTPITQEGSMARSIGYSSLLPGATTNAAKSAFSGSGNKLKGSRSGTPKASTPVAGSSTNPPPPTATPVAPTLTTRKGDGPQPLRLPHNQLFFGYEIKPLKKDADKEAVQKKPSLFEGAGQSLRGSGGKKRKGENDKGKGRSKGEPIMID